MSAHPRERGFALVAALWAVTILATVAYGVMMVTRSGAKLAGHRRQTAELTAVADAGVNLALFGLLQPAPAFQAPPDGTPYEMSFGDYVIRIRVQDEAGLVDINFASTDLLQSVMMGLGLDSNAAQALADRIADWRDPFPGKRLNGAKGDDYRLAGLSYGPRGGMFPSVDEVKLVLGMPGDLFDRLRPMLTVYSQSPAVDAGSAPAALLPLLPGMNADAAAMILRKRSGQENGENDTEARTSFLEAGSLVGHALEISAEVQGRDGFRLNRTAVVRITGHSSDPAWIYAWR